MIIRAILETLLEGEFICQISYPKLYRELQNEEAQININSTLSSLGRELRQTENNEAYYSAYDDLSNSKDTRYIQSQFEILRNQIAPVTSFLTLIMRVDNRDSILIPGDTLKFHDLLSRIEEEPAYHLDLKHIQRYELFKKLRTKTNNQDRLKATLETMEKKGYLSLVNSQSAIYQATGKIEYFYSCIEFIRDHEQIPLQDETDDQKDLSFDH